MKVLTTRSDKYPRKHVLKENTVSDFGGGLDLSDNDLNIKKRYAKVQTNFYRSLDGRLRLRYGVERLADMPSSTTGNVIKSEYYAGTIVAATDAGEIVAFPLNNPTAVAKLWPTGVAGKSWSTGLKVVNFAQSQGQLLIVNGVDKPLRLKSDFSIDFLGDIGNINSNINTPIAPYITTCDNFVVMAGQPNAPSKLHFSSKGTTGTFAGDTAPNDATTFDVGGAIAHGDNIIVGLAALNNFVFVAFETSTVVVQVGLYAGTVHVPTISDVFDTYGAISQRSMTVVDKELWYCDQTGVLKMARNQLGTMFIPDRMSQAVDPLLLKHLWTARNVQNVRNVFAVYNRVSSQYMLFVPKDATTPAKHCWVSTKYDGTEGGPSWSLFEGLNFYAACISSIGQLYLFTARTMYRYGDINNEFFNDNGAPITFDWETPWSVFLKYEHIKKIKAIRIYTQGKALFNVQMFVERIYKDRNGAYDPAAEMTFVAGDAGGFGNETGLEPYGGGRATSDPRIWKFDAKFMQGKFRITGSTTQDLQIVAFSVAYTLGGRKR